jgi:hypothetical protein
VRQSGAAHAHALRAEAEAARGIGQQCDAKLCSLARCSCPMSAQKNVEWLRHRIEQYQSITNDMCEAIEDFDEVEN